MPKPQSDSELEIINKIDKEYTLHPEKGVLTMVDHLRGLEVGIRVKRVRRLMHKMSVEAIYRKPRLPKLGPVKYI